LEKERNFEDLRFTDHLTNSKGGAMDLKVGGMNICELSEQTKFSVDPPTFGIVGLHKLNKILLRRVAHFANFCYDIISLG